MLHEVTGAISDGNNLDSSTPTINKCSTPNCCGFSYALDVSCTVCGKIISKPHSENERKRDFNVELIGAKKRIVVRTDCTISSPSSFAYPVVAVSLGKPHVFDSRKKTCIVSKDSLSFGVFSQGIWIPLVVKNDEVDELLFSEPIQVIFMRLKSQAFTRISKILGISANNARDDKMRRIVVVLDEKPQTIGSIENSNISLFLTVPQLEVFCTNVRLSGGICVSDLKPSIAQNILVANGVRLSRNIPSDSSPVRTKPINNFSSNGSETCERKLDNPLPPPIKPSVPAGGAGDSDDNLVILSDDDDDGDSNNAPEEVSPETVASKEPEAAPCKKMKLSFVYHPPGSKDGIQLTEFDLSCLLPGNFLNDAIINFYLKYLFYEQLTQFQRLSTHFFNCFFYSRLSSSPPDSNDGQNSEPLIMQRHAAVAKWTRRVDIFLKDFIIIPINENAHWFLGLVCYPWMAGMVSYTKLYENFAFDLCQITADFVDVDQLPVNSSNIGMEELTVLQTDKKGEAFDRWRRRRLAWLRRRGINAMPCILIFDSIPSHSRHVNLNIIRNYLQAEWNVRRSERDGLLTFNKDTIRGFSPRVPAQSNLVDCGIFLLHYVEMFFKKPVKHYTKDYFQNEMVGWFESELLGQKRQVIHALIQRIMQRDEQQNHQEAPS